MVSLEPVPSTRLESDEDINMEDGTEEGGERREQKNARSEVSGDHWISDCAYGLAVGGRSGSIPTTKRG
ncbi:hypothetical protein CVT26_013346 [Gymnopilus dilepis]|uniref:Uncharacterized protein n=1 Tax=Gymnopilus dilepis TaxID=231916 RepID=A0A409X5K1_9AGAR|nr:hypothetical protein CVT26_013346 [Gymnopilus dilepis]